MCAAQARRVVDEMLPGNSGLDLAINKQFVEKASMAKEGDGIARVGFSVD